MSARTILNPPINTALVDIPSPASVSATVTISFSANVSEQFTLTFPVYFSSTDNVLYTAYCKNFALVGISTGQWQDNPSSTSTSVFFYGECASAASNAEIIGLAVPY